MTLVIFLESLLHNFRANGTNMHFIFEAMTFLPSRPCLELQSLKAQTGITLMSEAFLPSFVRNLTIQRELGLKRRQSRLGDI